MPQSPKLHINRNVITSNKKPNGPTPGGIVNITATFDIPISREQGVYDLGGNINKKRYIPCEEYITPNSTVLDCACGFGTMTNEYANKCKQIYGVDIDSDCVAFANTRYSKPNLNYIKGSITSTPFKDNMFDLIISVETIEHVDDDLLSLRELKRIINKEGYIYITVPLNKNSRKVRSGYHKREYISTDAFINIANKAELRYLQSWNIDPITIAVLLKDE